MSPPESTWDDPQQVIADLRRANDELRRTLGERTAERDARTQERDEALQRETATAEVLKVINASPGDLAPVFEAMLEKALHLCGAAFGMMNTYDGERFHRAADYGVPPAYAGFRQRNQRAFAPDTAPGRILAGEDLVHNVDLKAEEAYERGDPNRRALVDLGGARSHLAVALRKDGRLLGHIGIYRQEVRPFTEKQIALLQNFAAQAVIAMENARLITETREALEQQTATAEVLGVINSSPGDLAPVFDAILEKAHSLSGAAHGHLSIYDGEQFRAAATHGVPEAFAALLRQPFQPGLKVGQRLLAGEPLIHIPDMTALSYAPDDRIGRAAVELAGARTILIIPLRKDGALLGYITAHRKEVRPFTDKQIALLQNFAAQAVIAMENARLVTETREALEQQTATAEVLGVINSSPGDLAPVFDAILEKAHSLCGIALGELELHQDGKVHAVAIRGVSGSFADLLIQPFTPPPESPPARLIAGEQMVQITDVAELARQQPDDPRAQAGAQDGLRTALFVPLRKDDGLLGYITGYRREVRPFSEKEIALLQNFAAQAVIAIENTRLLNETREALEQQTATAEVLGVINSSPGDLTPVFDAMLEKAMRLCEAAFGIANIYDGERFQTATLRGVPEGLAELWLSDPPAPGPDSPLARILNGEDVVHIEDFATSAGYMRGEPRPRAMVELGGAHSYVVVALRKEGRVLGTLGAYRQEVRPFTEKQIALLQNFAAQAVIAMENARLINELRQRTDEVAELNRGLEARVAEQVEELGRVGRLKRFLAPQLAELIVSQGDEKILESHRREIVVVFCDLRGYTAFTETAEPEEVLDFLREYHGALGPLVSQFEGTLDQFSGDGIMVFFNDPVPIPDPAERAVNMAVAMREVAGRLIAALRRRRGRELGFGVGIAQGYATLGQIGFADRSGYTAIGTVCNLASRLCAEAKDGQILVAQPVAVAVEETIALEEMGSLALKGLTQPVVAYNVPLAATQPALRVIDGGPPSD